MSFMIKSDVSEQYLLEEDAVEGFRQAVNNGQIRLALQILVDIVDVFEGFIASFVEDEDEEEVQENVQQTKVEEEKTSVVEPVVQETKEEEPQKKHPAKKTSSKEEESKTAAE